MIKVSPILIFEIVAIGFFCYLAYWGLERKVDLWAFLLFTCVIMILSYVTGYCARMIEE